MPGAQSTSQWQSADAWPGNLSPELQQFLQKASERSTRLFEQTPWGKQTEVTIQSRYYAGSGRQCLRLLVAPAAAGARIAIACQQNDQWVPVRPVTQLLNAQ
jgi:hypothetical protein